MERNAAAWPDGRDFLPHVGENIKTYSPAKTKDGNIPGLIFYQVVYTWLLTV